MHRADMDLLNHTRNEENRENSAEIILHEKTDSMGAGNFFDGNSQPLERTTEGLAMHDGESRLGGISNLSRDKKGYVRGVLDSIGAGLISAKDMYRSGMRTGIALFAAGAIAASAVAVKPAYSSDLPILTDRHIELSDSIGDIWKDKRYFGTIYGEGTYMKFDDETETPAFVNASLGYNLLGRSASEGMFLLPFARLNAKINDSDYPWDRYVSGGLGAAYLKPPFIIGADVGYKKFFDDEQTDGEFLRGWAGYWNRHEGVPLRKSLSFPLRPVLTQYVDIEANTLDDNVVGNARLEGSINVLESGGLKVGPFIAGKVNYDSKEQPWNRYLEYSGGIKMLKGNLAAYLEIGRRNSFHDDVSDRDYQAATLAFFHRF